MNIMTIATGGFGIVAIVAAGAMLLPRLVHVERQATFNGSVESVIKLAASNKGYQRFNPYLSADPDLQISHFGPVSGKGSGFKFDGKDGKGSQTVAEVTDNKVRYDIDLGMKGKPVQTITAKPSGDGVLVTWSMDADMGMNPLARIIGLFMDGMIGEKLEKGLSNLAAAT